MTNIIVSSNLGGTAWTAISENITEVSIDGDKVTITLINGRELINEQYDYIGW